MTATNASVEDELVHLRHSPLNLDPVCWSSGVVGILRDHVARVVIGVAIIGHPKRLYVRTLASPGVNRESGV